MRRYTDLCRTTTTLRPLIADHRRRLTAGTICLAAAAALAAVTVITGERVLLPVTLDLPGGSPGASDPTLRFEISRVDFVLALVVILLYSAVVNFAIRMPGARWFEYGIVAPITVFLVAQLNGITDAGALIAIYSLTGAMVLFDLAQLRSDRISATSPWALGTVVGIVPWGIIALHQVGGSFAGHPAPFSLQLITMSMLIMSAATSVTFWRERAGRGSPHAFSSLATVTTVLFAIEASAVLVAS